MKWIKSRLKTFDKEDSWYDGLIIGLLSGAALGIMIVWIAWALTH